MVWFRIISLFFFSFSLNSKEISQDELKYFELLDTNNDKYVSYTEIENLTNIIFQLIDMNQDNKISIEELNDLNEIINLLK